ncbi:hypothetical protein PICMEDRAFT_101487 [Pichia membranifaciens NRRL Y-2026]|uniref:Uncharacterized protein n=1 Tax=Pichia membranifaciens NRRL Y-2026 TaxID=763406 RepID=A0A1E3NTV8_9ASCO|nr:hypothetical protein PICMEDRAFT_101487 [Pichia membranifaciens NRRL Y-2026]ODQ49426.1 hypothetical protein PICMEDRAFT_101487 [Pichia membranifaciens NRRL Y-2026]
MRLSNIGLLVTTLISNIGISNADTDNELEKRNSCSTQVSSCSLTPYNHGYPAASVSWGNTVTDLGNGIYEGTMNFQGKDCSQFDNTNEIKIDGGAATVVVYSYNGYSCSSANPYYSQCVQGTSSPTTTPSGSSSTTPSTTPSGSSSTTKPSTAPSDHHPPLSHRLLHLDHHPPLSHRLLHLAHRLPHALPRK